MITTHKMAQETKNENYGFPNHMIPADRKNKGWHLQYSKAFHKEFTNGTGKILRWANDDYTENRLYAKGMQPIDQYKEMLGMKKRNGKWDKTWRNLDYNILAIFPRFKTVIKNRLLKQPRELILTAIDQTSMSNARKRKAEILDYMANKDFYDEIAQMGIATQSPFEPGEPIPENSSEIDLHMEMYPKNKYIMYMKDQIDLTLLNNDWKQIEEEIMDDLIEVGTAGTRTWLDTSGAIRINRVLAERLITNSVKENDFKDMVRIGHYEEITISQLRSQVPEGTFSEEDYCVMASRSGRTYDAPAYDRNLEQYPYDHEKITVLRWECYSADDKAYVVAPDKKGNPKIQKRDNPKWLGDKSDEEYSDYHKKTRGENRKVEREAINNLYGCSYVVDTDYVFNYGPVVDTIRNVETLRDVESGYTMYSLDFDSIVRQCKPVLDNIQMNWLQYQHHLSQSKPTGLAIEKRALGQVDLGNGQKLSSGKILQMYSETGSYIYIGTDQHGRPYPYKPLEELKGGISDAAAQHLNFIVMNIDLLRGILGLNEVTDASTIDPKVGKAIGEMAQFNTNNALGTIYHGFISIYERTCRKIAMLVPDAIKIPNKARLESIGLANQTFMELMKDLPFMSFGIKIEAGITDDLRARLTEHLNANLKVNGGSLLPEDVFMVEQEPNLQRAYMLLSQKRRQREAQNFEQEMMKMKQQADGNTQTAVALEEEKRKTAEAEAQAYERKKMIDAQAKILEIREKAQWDLILMKYEKGAELTLQEEELVNNLMITEMTIAKDMAVAKMNAQNKERQSLASKKK